MKYGVREICEVVLRAKATQTVGNKKFYKNEPVIYFDTLKTSSMEGAATTVYAQGGRGNSRLMAWEGERTITFTMEDALISPAGFMILSGAGLVEPIAPEKDKEGKAIIVHKTETVKVSADGTITLSEEPYDTRADDLIYVMKLDDEGNVNTEPYLYKKDDEKSKKIVLGSSNTSLAEGVARTYTPDSNAPKAGDLVLVDYYTEKYSGVQQIEITPDKFGGNFYLEASTLFRDTNGVDVPAEFIIPNCKIQSNFTFTMASTGDPSTFTFTMDAFPDYTRFDQSKKVLAAIQIMADEKGNTTEYRTATVHVDKEET